MSIGKSYSMVPGVKVTDPSSIVHKLIPRLAHSIVNRFNDLLAVAKSYPVLNSAPQRAYASSAISFKFTLKLVVPDVVAIYAFTLFIYFL